MARKRKVGQREPNGRIQREPGASPVSAVRRHLAIIKTNQLDPKYGTPLGMLTIDGRLTEAHFVAGKRVAERRERADRALGLPPRTPGAVNYDAVRGKLLLADADPEKSNRDQAAYYEIVDLLGGASPEMRAIECVVIYDQPPAGHKEFLALRDGLDTLVRHWKIS